MLSICSAPGQLTVPHHRLSICTSRRPLSGLLPFTSRAAVMPAYALGCAQPAELNRCRRHRRWAGAHSLLLAALWETWTGMLCCAVLCCAVLCCAVLGWAGLCCAHAAQRSTPAQRTFGEVRKAHHPNIVLVLAFIVLSRDVRAALKQRPLRAAAPEAGRQETTLGSDYPASSLNPHPLFLSCLASCGWPQPVCLLFT